jgi:hypothetical protein
MIVQHARRFPVFADQLAVEPGSFEIGGDFSRQAAALRGGHRFVREPGAVIGDAAYPGGFLHTLRLAVASRRHDDRPPAVEHVSTGDGILREICRDGNR